MNVDYTEVSGPDLMDTTSSGVEQAQWRTVHWISPVLNSWQSIAALLVVVGVQGGGALASLAFETRSDTLTLVAAGFAALFLLVAVIGAYSYFAWRATSFTVTDEAVWFRSGILFKQVKHVGLERIQAVNVVRPFVARAFGLGRLTVEAAGGGGAALSIGFLKAPDLQELRVDILARASGAHASAARLSQRREGGQTGAVGSPEQWPVYSVKPGMILGAAATTPFFITSVALFILSFAVLIVALPIEGVVAVTAPLLFVSALSAIVFFWSRFVGEYGFATAISEEGVRVTRGLLETRSETIPPSRVHAVSVSQPLLWRAFGWYRVEMSQASLREAGTSPSVAASTMLPVGTKEQALMAVQLVIPDLGVNDAASFLDRAVHGSRRNSSFISLPPRAFIFDPLAYNRRGVTLTDTCVVSRDGWINRAATVVPFPRIQSFALQSGPIEQTLGLVTAVTGLVPGVVQQRIPHLRARDAAMLAEEVQRESARRRDGEPPERWLARVRHVTTPEGATTPNSATIGGVAEENTEEVHGR